jgi:uncharacterized protein YjbJ (UPF0337 family)
MDWRDTSADAVRRGLNITAAGHRLDMKFIKGFIIGTIVGVAVGSSINEQQRKQVVARMKKQAEPVSGAVADNVGRIADRATDKAAGAVDQAGAAVADAIDDDDATTSPSTVTTHPA